MLDKQNFKDRHDRLCQKPENRTVKKRISVYGFYLRGDLLMLVKPTWHDKWDLPGGGVEEGEQLLDALKREFTEETGFKIISLDSKYIYKQLSNFYADDLDEYYENEAYYYNIREIEPSQEFQRNEKEISELKFLKIKELNKTNTKEFHLNAIKQIIKII